MKNKNKDSSAARFDGKAARSAATYTVVLQTAAKFGGLICLILLVRLLSTEEYGAYNIYYAMFGFVATIFSLGIPNTIARFLPEYHAKHNDRLAHRLYAFGSIARFAANLLVLVALWYFWEDVVDLFKLTAYANAFYVFAAILLTRFQCNLLTITLSAYLLQKFSISGQLIFSAIKIIGYSFALFFLNGELVVVLAVDLAAYTAMFLWLRIAYGRFVAKKHNKAEVDAKKERRRVMRYAFFYNFNDVGQFAVGTKADNLVLAALMDPVSVGAYAFVRKAEEVCKGFLPVRFFQDVVRPIFFTLDIEQDRERVNSIFQVLCKITYVTLFPLTCYVILVFQPLTDIVLEGKFREHVALVAAVFLFTLLTGIDRPLMMVVQLAERAGAVFISKIFGIYNIAALFLLIPILGTMGAAIATGTTLLFSRLFLWGAVRRNITWRGMGTFALYSLLYWMIVFIFNNWLASYIENIVLEFVTITSTICVAFVAYLRGPIFNDLDKRLLTDTLRERELRILQRSGLLKVPGIN